MLTVSDCFLLKEIEVIFKEIWTLYKDIVTLRKLLKPADCVNIHDYGFELLLPAFYGKKVYWQINDLPSFLELE